MLSEFRFELSFPYSFTGRFSLTIKILHKKSGIMLGGSNSNHMLPVFLGESGFQCHTNASNQLQLFGNCKFSALIVGKTSFSKILSVCYIILAMNCMQMSIYYSFNSILLLYWLIFFPVSFFFWYFWMWLTCW